MPKRNFHTMNEGAKHSEPVVKSEPVLPSSHDELSSLVAMPSTHGGVRVPLYDPSQVYMEDTRDGWKIQPFPHTRPYIFHTQQTGKGDPHATNFPIGDVEDPRHILKRLGERSDEVTFHWVSFLAYKEHLADLHSEKFKNDAELKKFTHDFGNNVLDGVKLSLTEDPFKDIIVGPVDASDFSIEEQQFIDFRKGPLGVHINADPQTFPSVDRMKFLFFGGSLGTPEKISEQQVNLLGPRGAQRSEDYQLNVDAYNVPSDRILSQEEFEKNMKEYPKKEMCFAPYANPNNKGQFVNTSFIIRFPSVVMEKKSVQDEQDASKREEHNQHFDKILASTSLKDKNTERFKMKLNIQNNRTITLHHYPGKNGQKSIGTLKPGHESYQFALDKLNEAKYIDYHSHLNCGHFIIGQLGVSCGEKFETLPLPVWVFSQKKLERACNLIAQRRKTDVKDLKTIQLFGNYGKSYLPRAKEMKMVPGPRNIDETEQAVVIKESSPTPDSGASLAPPGNSNRLREIVPAGTPPPRPQPWRWNTSISQPDSQEHYLPLNKANIRWAAQQKNFTRGR